MIIPDIELVALNGDKHTFPELIKSNSFNLILFYNTNCLGCTGRAIPLAYKLKSEFDFISLIVIHSSFRPATFTREEVLAVFTDNESPIQIYRSLVRKRARN